MDLSIQESNLMVVRSISAGPLYEQVKAYVLDRVIKGELGVNDRVPSENELVRMLGISRMTVNRALNDLAAEGVVVRLPGVGTFVAPSLPQSHPLHIHNIAEEIRARGNEHTSCLMDNRQVTADMENAREFHIPLRSRLFSTQIVHFENAVAIQYEDRLVNPMVAPDYLDQDFSEHPPHDYLMQVAPLQRAEHVLQAGFPPEAVREALQMAQGEPCLVLRRRTWSSNAVASCAKLYYPASRYEFAGPAS